MKKGIGRVIDGVDYTLVNSSNHTYEDEPFIYPSQAQQIFYSKDPIDPSWSVVSLETSGHIRHPSS
mgnify:CR=1 FL=1